MPVLKVKKDGVWTETIGAISDADTLDGYHAEAFALTEDVDELRELVSKKFVMTITKNDDGTYSADKTFAEVYAAGYDAFAVLCPNDNDNYVFTVNERNEDVVFFQCDFLGQGSMHFRFYEDGTIEFFALKYCGLPTVTLNDDGAFLRVVDGAWATVKLVDAEEATF